MITTYLTIAGMLAFILSPALIPVTVHAIHAVRQWQPTWAPAGWPATRGVRHPAASRLPPPDV